MHVPLNLRGLVTRLERRVMQAGAFSADRDGRRGQRLEQPSGSMGSRIATHVVKTKL
jgi:hypothetical protein